MRCMKMIALSAALILLFGTCLNAMAEALEIEFGGDGEEIDFSAELGISSESTEMAVIDLQQGIDLQGVDGEGSDSGPTGEESAPEAPAGEDASQEADSNIDLNSYSKEYSNDKTFKVNGKKIYANMVPDKGDGQCWAWAQDMYKIIWGVNFDSDFEGSSSKGYNYLRNLNDTDRKLTPEHLMEYIKECEPGATIRICSCTTRCSHFDDDGLECGHEGHSLILVAKKSDGLVTMDDHSGSQHTRYYTWEGFCNSWAKYTYIKYIKWPKAPAVPSTEVIDGVSVRKCDVTYRVRSSATDGVKVLSAPSNGTTLATLKYPDTFAATKKSASQIEGKTWLYGTTESGVVGWVVENSSIIDVRETIGVYQIKLDRSKLLLGVGVSYTMPVTIVPEDATKKNLRWASSDESIVTVDDGVVTGVGVGTAKIGVASEDGNAKAVCEVQVIKVDTSKTLTKTGSNGTVKMVVGQQLQLYAKFATSKGWKLQDVSSSNTACATVDMSGVVTAVGVGEAVITVRTTNEKKATLKVQVVDPFAPTKIKLNKSTLNMKKGTKFQLEAKLSPSTAVSTLSWKSDNNDVAVVDENGLVYAVGKGSCWIGCKTVNGLYAKVRVRVSRK